MDFQVYLIGYYTPLTSANFCDKEEGDIQNLHTTYLSPLINHACNTYTDSYGNTIYSYPEHVDYESPVILQNMKKTSIYNFKFTVFSVCYIYSIWYPNPENIGNFEQTTLGDPITVSYDNFLYEAKCNNPTILYNISISFSGSAFSTTLPPFV